MTTQKAANSAVRSTGRQGLLLAAAIATALLPALKHAQSAEFDNALDVVGSASATAAAPDNLRSAWKRLAEADAAEIPRLLRAIEADNPAAENWLRAAADAVAERTLSTGGELPVAELLDLLGDTEASPRGRRVAYEWLAEVAPDTAGKRLAGMMNDPSLELRYDAIAAGIEVAKSIENDEQRKASYLKLLGFARDLEQLKTCKAAIEELGGEVDLAKKMGFVTAWRIVGPFDNTNEAGYAVAYLPEEKVSLDAEYQGKEETITWLDDPVTTDDELGMIDVAEALGPVKGAVAYAFAQWNAPQATSAYIRYSSKNATKLWINGEQVAANEVYHSGSSVDQYVVGVELKKGTNDILLKVCQNEQSQPWAQDWQFQLRVTDQLAGVLEKVK